MLLQRTIPSKLVRCAYRYHSAYGSSIIKDMEKSKTKQNQSDKRLNKYIKRTKDKDKGNKLKPPQNICLRVLGTGKQCTTRSLLVDFFTHKYLFNCSEGCQRGLGDRKLRVGRVQNVFITKANWKNVSGLAGLHLTIDDTLAPVLKLTAPRSITPFTILAGSAAEGRTTKLEITGVDDKFVEDEAMKVEVIEVLSSRSAEEKTSQSTGIEPETKRARLENEKDSAIVYLCQPFPTARKVCVDKILQLSIPRDKTIGQLVDGNTVILEDGREIKPEDILQDEVHTPPFLVVECEDSSYLPSLNGCKPLQQYYSDGQMEAMESEQTKQEEDQEIIDDKGQDMPETSAQGVKETDPVRNQMHMVVHFTPTDVVQQQAYQDWMKRFGSHTRHLLLNDWGSQVSLHRPFLMQACFNLVHPTIFPLLPQQIQQEAHVEQAEIDVDNVAVGHPGLSYILRGSAAEVFKYSRDNYVRLDNEEMTEKVRSKILQEEVNALQTKLQSFSEADLVDTRHYPEIVFLGTGSAKPAVRNVSAILVHLSDDACMLFDVGEDTAGQIRRFYGDKADEIFCKLKAIFISHRHVDHHMGVTTVILEREKCLKANTLTTDPLLMVAPKNYRDFFTRLSNIFNLELPEKIAFVSSEDLLCETSLVLLKSRADLDIHFPITSIKTCRVQHRKDPFGLVLTLENGYKVVYSGDTVPCERLVDAGKGCDLLIHEATMEDGLIDDAKKKDHSTTSEAIKVGKMMGAKFTILTHFSQRYGKIPLFNENFHDKMGVAFDNMKVSPRELHILPHLVPALKALWHEEYESLKNAELLREVHRDRDRILAQQNESETSGEESRESETSRAESENNAKETETKRNKKGWNKGSKKKQYGNESKGKDLRKGDQRFDQRQ